MEASEVSDGRAGQSVDGSVLSSSSFKENEDLDSDPAFYEKFVLDMESYWDDLGARLTVSRMVNDSVIKGMVNAVVEDADEKISLKEAELQIARDRLQSYESNSGKFSLLSMPDHLMMKINSQTTKSELPFGFLDANVVHGYTENLNRLKITAEEQLQRFTDDLKHARSSDPSCSVKGYALDVPLVSALHRENRAEEFLKIEELVDAFRKTLSTTFKQIDDMFFSYKASMWEHQWEDEVQREVSTIMVRSYIKDLHNEFEAKLWEQKGLINNLNKNWLKRIDELSAMRLELDTLSKSLCSSEQGLLLSHNSHDFEDWNNGKRKEHISQKVLGNHHLLTPCYSEESGTIMAEASVNSPKPMLEVAESPQLKSMTKEDLISYYKSEMTKMRRQHDSVLQEKTEELFRLKREFLKEKGSSPFRKDKEFEVLRKKIPEVLLKLDEILLDSEKLSVVRDNHEEVHGLKDKIDTLFFENQCLRGLLVDKRKEIMCLSSRVSDAASQMSLHSSLEGKFLKQIEKLKWCMEDVMTEASIRDELWKDISRDLVDKHKSAVEDLEIHTYIMQDVLSIIYRGVAYDAMAYTNDVMLKYYADKTSLKAVLMQKEEALCLEIEEKEKLKQKITLLMEENENFASEAGSTLFQQKEQFDLFSKEINMLRDKISKQEILISQKNMELDSINGRLDETLQQIDKYETDIDSLNKRNKILWESLEEAEKENDMLHDIIEEKENSVSSSVTKEKERGKQMESIVIAVSEFSKTVVDFENRLAEIVGYHDVRLKELSNQCNQLLQQANLLRKKGLLYKHMLEIKCSNLQKAETEVDLLGDEVDALLSLLGKVYIALDHYSPVLQHYPGVMEILKLVQRELKGEK